jgi:hypothetical protein
MAERSAASDQAEATLCTLLEKLKSSEALKSAETRQRGDGGCEEGGTKEGAAAVSGLVKKVQGSLRELRKVVHPVGGGEAAGAGPGAGLRGMCEVWGDVVNVRALLSLEGDVNAVRREAGLLARDLECGGGRRAWERLDALKGAIDASLDAFREFRAWDLGFGGFGFRGLGVQGFRGLGVQGFRGSGV